MLKIGETTFKHGIFLAPMAGVTDKAFRHMCKKYGAEAVTTEMISSRALVFDDKKTKELAKICDYEKPCALQIFGNDPTVMAKAAYIALSYSPFAIDINMGCPTPKIVNNGDGSALMKNPLLCGNIVKEVYNALEGRVPVTVKMRIGFDKNNINVLEVAKQCEANGAAAITVHARTREQMYASPIYPEYIKAVKEAVRIPIIGNGDIYTPQDAEKMKITTGCDAVMIGRGALGNPFIFENTLRLFEGKETFIPTDDRIKSDIEEHITLLIADKGEFIGIREARKHIAWYIKGRANSASIRDRVNRAQSFEEIMRCADEAFN